MHGKLLIPLLLLASSSCIVPRLEVRPALSNMGVDGDFGATSIDSGSGAQANATSDFDALGLGGKEQVFQPRLDFDWVGPHIMVSSFSTDFSGRGVTEGEIELDGRTIGANVAVDTDLGIDVHRLALTWDFVPTKMVEAGLGLGVTAVGFELNMAEVGDPNIMIEADETFPVPTVAGRLGLNLGRFGASLDVGWLDFSRSDADVTVLDYELGATFDVLGRGQRLAVSLMAGYRGLDIAAQYEDDEDEADLDFLLSGFLYGLSISF